MLAFNSCGGRNVHKGGLVGQFGTGVDWCVGWNLEGFGKLLIGSCVRQFFELTVVFD